MLYSSIRFRKPEFFINLIFSDIFRLVNNVTPLISSSTSAYLII